MVLNAEKSNFMFISKDIDDAETLDFNDLTIKIVNNWKFFE